MNVDLIKGKFLYIYIYIFEGKSAWRDYSITVCCYRRQEIKTLALWVRVERTPHAVHTWTPEWVALHLSVYRRVCIKQFECKFLKFADESSLMKSLPFSITANWWRPTDELPPSTQQEKKQNNWHGGRWQQHKWLHSKPHTSVQRTSCFECISTQSTFKVRSVKTPCTIHALKTELSVQLHTVNERHIGGGGGVMALMWYQTLVHTS